MKTFKAWKAKFDLELAARKALGDEEKLKALTTKEREEWKKAAVRLTGKSSRHFGPMLILRRTSTI